MYTILLLKSRYLTHDIIDVLMKVRYIGSRVEEASQCEVKEEQCEAQTAIKEEDYDEEISKLKTRKEVKRMYF